MILVTGYTGVVGRAIEKFLAKKFSIVGLPLLSNHSQTKYIDIRDYSALRAVFDRYQPEIVLHLARIKDIRRCQLEPEYCYEVNVTGTKNVSQLAEIFGSKMVLLSSDYVFDGKSARKSEDCMAIPQQNYGKQMLESEIIVRKINGIVCRTAGVYGLNSPRSTFPEFVLRNLRQEIPIDLYEDLYNSPTYLPDLCIGLEALFNLAAPGVYHICGPDRISRYEFGVAVARSFGLNEQLLTPINGAEIEKLRPTDLSLTGKQTENLLGITMQGVYSALDVINEDYADD